MASDKFNRVRTRAISLQKASGTKVIPEKKVYKMTLAEASKKASLEIKAEDALKKMNKK
jgi:hypothetical protein